MSPKFLALIEEKGVLIVDGADYIHRAWLGRNREAITVFERQVGQPVDPGCIRGQREHNSACGTYCPEFAYQASRGGDLGGSGRGILRSQAGNCRIDRRPVNFQFQVGQVVVQPLLLEDPRRLSRKLRAKEVSVLGQPAGTGYQLAQRLSG